MPRTYFALLPPSVSLAPPVIQQLTGSGRWHMVLRVVCMHAWLKILDPDTSPNAPHIAEIVHECHAGEFAAPTVPPPFQRMSGVLTTFTCVWAVFGLF